MRKAALTLFLTASFAMAQTQTVFINGVALQATKVTENGVTYYKISAADLQRVGALTAGGVTPNTDAIKGCVGDTLFNGVYTVQLLSTRWDGDRFGVTLKVANASKKELFNFMVFGPSDVKAANKAGNAFELPNYTGTWVDSLLPGASLTVTTFTSNITQKDLTRLLIRPSAAQIKEMQEKKLPLAKVSNMEWDLTCKKK